MSSPTTQLFNALDQAKQRTNAFFFDQHGRRYWAAVELKTGDPVGGIYADQWTAPMSPAWCAGRLVPDAKYMKIVRGRGQPHIEIQYEEWLRDWDAADRMRKSVLDELISRSPVDIATMQEYRKNPPPEIMKTIGAGPIERRPREFIAAAMKGNRWALGLSDKMPDWAKPVMAQWELVQPQGQSYNPAEMGEYPDADDDEPEEERFIDIEEEHDPEATGGKRVPVKGKPKSKAPAKAGAGE